MLGKKLQCGFYSKKPKNYLSGEMPLYIRITVDVQKKMTTARIVILYHGTQKQKSAW